MTKRLLALALLVGMFSGLISSPARAEVIVNKPCSGGGTFKIEDNVVTGSYRDCIGSAVIPEGVTKISQWAFGESSGITSVTIPASVTSLEESVFVMSDIVEINVASGNANFKSTDGVLFTKNGSTLLVYPSAKAGAYTMPAGVTTIGDGAFAYTRAITTLTISASVSSIGNDAFVDSSLSAINVASGSNSLKSVGGILFSKNGQTLIKYVGGQASFTIPADVKTIGIGAFRSSLLTAVTIPASVTSIEKLAFASSYGLASVTFAEGSQLASIGDFAFEEAAFTGVNIPATVTAIGERAFGSNANLVFVNFALGSRLTRIGDHAFDETALTSVTIPASVLEIGNSAFRNIASLGVVTFLSGSELTRIGDYAFVGAALTSVTIPASVLEIGNAAFRNIASLGVVTFSPGSELTRIGDYAFVGAALESITIPKTVGSIGEYAFSNNSKISSVEFETGSQLTSIGNRAFYEAVELTAIAIPAGVTVIGSGAFRSASNLSTVSFAASSQLETIGSEAFQYASKLTAITIPASVIEIYPWAFASNSILTSVTFEADSKLTRIWHEAFANDANLTDVTIPANVDEIYNGAFKNTSSLTSIRFLGNAPAQVFPDAFLGVNAIAYASSCATGFPSGDSDRWNGLEVSIEASVDCLVIYKETYPAAIAAEPLAVSGQVSQAPPAPPKSPAGYTFGGWSATAGGGDVIEFPYGEVGANKNITLYSQWIPKIFSVTYNSGGGSRVDSGSFITYGFVQNEPAAPTREGYTFIGWGNASDSNDLITFPYNPGQVLTDITLYAKWAKNDSPPPITPTTKPTTKPTPTTKPKTSFVPKLTPGSSSLNTAGKAAIQKIVKNSGADATYTITGQAGKSSGVPTRFVRALAIARAEKVKAQLVKLGVKKSKIKIKIKITESRVAPQTTIKVG